MGDDIKYYFNKLTPERQQLYKHIYNGLNRKKASIDIHGHYIFNEIHSIVEYVLLDNPNLFFVDGNSISYQTSEMKRSLNINYLYDNNVIRKLQSHINNKVKPIIENLSHLTVDSFQAEQYIFEYLAENIQYCSVPDIEEAIIIS